MSNIKQFTRRLDLNNVEESIRLSFNKSENVLYNYYVDSKLQEHGFTHLQMLKLLKEGCFTNIEEEKGYYNRFGYTMAFCFAGYKEACHLRCWFDVNSGVSECTDFFMSEDKKP